MGEKQDMETTTQNQLQDTRSRLMAGKLYELYLEWVKAGKPKR